MFWALSIHTMNTGGLRHISYIGYKYKLKKILHSINAPVTLSFLSGKIWKDRQCDRHVNDHVHYIPHPHIFLLYLIAPMLFSCTIMFVCFIKGMGDGRCLFLACNFTIGYFGRRCMECVSVSPSP